MVPGRVSVLIPLYNRNEYIRQTIESVLLQDYENTELIVIDDGSTDGGFETVIELSRDHGFAVLHHPGRENRGQSAALNLGLRHASGEYVAILDSDDLFVRGKIRRQVELLSAMPEVGLVYGMGKAIDARGDVLYSILDENHVELNDPNIVLLDCYLLLPQNAMVRRCFYDEVGDFDQSLRSAQDHDMLIRLAEVCRFHFDPSDFFRYRRHDDSISKKGLEVRWRAGFVILKKARSRYPYRFATVRKRFALLNYRLGTALITYRRNRIEALARIVLAGVLDPLRALRIMLRLERNY
jgi:glycosyltransferase involved in cell wall biosynthesis